jgi:hypothetical protein
MGIEASWAAGGVAVGANVIPGGVIGGVGLGAASGERPGLAGVSGRGDGESNWLAQPVTSETESHSDARTLNMRLTIL